MKYINIETQIWASDLPILRKGLRQRPLSICCHQATMRYLTVIHNILPRSHNYCWCYGVISLGDALWRMAAKAKKHSLYQNDTIEYWFSASTTFRLTYHLEKPEKLHRKIPHLRGNDEWRPDCASQKLKLSFRPYGLTID